MIGDAAEDHSPKAATAVARHDDKACLPLFRGIGNRITSLPLDDHVLSGAAKALAHSLEVRGGLVALRVDDLLEELNVGFGSSGRLEDTRRLRRDVMAHRL